MKKSLSKLITLNEKYSRSPDTFRIKKNGTAEFPAYICRNRDQNVVKSAGRALG